MAGSSADTMPTSSDGTYDVGHMMVENVDVIEEVDIGIKQEEIPEDISFPDIKSEPNEWWLLPEMYVEPLTRPTHTSHHSTHPTPATTTSHSTGTLIHTPRYQRLNVPQPQKSNELQILWCM
jgi:hypothetical protein